MKKLLIIVIALTLFALVGCNDSTKNSNDFEGVYVLYSMNPDKEVEREERVFIQFNGGAYMSYKSKTGEPVLIDFKKEYKACTREEYNESDFYNQYAGFGDNVEKYLQEKYEIEILRLFKYKNMGDGFIYFFGYNSMFKYADGKIFLVMPSVYTKEDFNYYFKKI